MQLIALDRSFILFEAIGVDAERYLHGRLTQDCKKLEINTIAETLLLSPKGKIQGQFLLFRNSNDHFYLLSDPLNNSEYIQETQAAITSFKVADRLEVKPYGNFSYAILCSTLEEFLTAFNLSNEYSLLSTFKAQINKIDCLFFIRPFGEKLIIHIFAENELNFNLPICSDELFAILRIKNKSPMLYLDFPADLIGTDINYQNKISFTKGCYSGQEAIEMSIARGRPTKKLVIINSYIFPEILPDNIIQTTTEKKIATIETLFKIDNLFSSFAIIPYSITTTDLFTWENAKQEITIEELNK